MKPCDNILETIRQHTGEINSYCRETFKLELWWSPETKTVEGFNITPFGSDQIKNNFEQQPKEDIEQTGANQNHSRYSPQEQEFIPQDIKKEEPSAPPKFSTLFTLPHFSTLTDKQKLVFLLYLAKLNIRDSAKIMGIKKSPCHKHLKSALKKLMPTC